MSNHEAVCFVLIFVKKSFVIGWVVFYVPLFVQNNLFALFLGKITVNVNGALIREIEASTLPHGLWEEIERDLVFIQ